MATYPEIASEFSALADRIKKTWVSHVPKDQTFLEHQGWQHLPLTPTNIADFSRTISERIAEVATDDPKGDYIGYWSQVGARAKKITFANFGNDPNSVVKSTCDFLFWVALDLPTAPASVGWEKVKVQNVLPRSLSHRLKVSKRAFIAHRAISAIQMLIFGKNFYLLY